MALASAVEFSVVAAILDKQLDVGEVDRKSLSQIGQTIHKAVSKLSQETKNWDIKSIILVVTDVFGIDRHRLEEYFVGVEKHHSTSMGDAYKILQDRTSLIKVTNEVQSQLTTGDINLDKLREIIDLRSSKTSNVDLTSVSEDLVNGSPEAPSGPKLLSLPRLSECTNGVFGIWVVGGVPAIGKSTLVDQQIAVDVSREMPVIIYDHENTRRVILHRWVQSFGLDKTRIIGKNIYIRESLRSLSRDLARIKAPAVLIVDSIQKISTRNDDRREGLDSWIRRFEELKQSGYHVILVSEINRASYTGVPRLDMFKETGALEYAADAGICLTEKDGGLIGAWVVKNRHYPDKGQISLLERSKPFWFSEIKTEVF